MSKVALKHQKKHIAKHHLKQPTLLISEKATDIYIINIWYDDDDDAAAPALASDSLAAHKFTTLPQSITVKTNIPHRHHPAFSTVNKHLLILPSN